MGLDLTRGQIIRQGLEKAARPDLITDARLWLNLFLEEMYYNQDWDWLVKSADSLVVTQGGELPGDYRSSKSAVLVTNNNTSDIDNELVIVSNAAEWDDIERGNAGSVGTPKYMYVDRNEEKFYFSPAPESGLTFNLKYYHIPEIHDHEDVNNDDARIKWGLPYSILIDQIKAMAMEYNDDTRQDKSMQMIDKKLNEYKVNSHDRRAGRTRIPLGKSFKKRWGY
jgi:hypothetical protein